MAETELCLLDSQGLATVFMPSIINADILQVDPKQLIEVCYYNGNWFISIIFYF